MSGNQQPPTDGNTNLPSAWVGALSVLFSLALILYGLRMYTRIRPAFVLAAPDYIITMAFLCESVIFTSLIIAIAHGMGRHTFYGPKDGQTTVLRCIFAVELVAFWTTSLSRISIGTLLLRFDISKTWKAMLWILIYIQLAIAIGSSIFNFLMCRPVHALWKDVPNATCLSLHVLKTWGYSYSVLGLVSDLIFAIMPMCFIWTLNRPRIERALITVLMATGVVAAVAGAMKVYYMDSFVPLFMWYRVEEMSLIISACVPSLKLPIERMLHRSGVPTFHFATCELNTIRSNLGDGVMDGSKA